MTSSANDSKLMSQSQDLKMNSIPQDRAKSHRMISAGDLLALPKFIVSSHPFVQQECLEDKLRSLRCKYKRGRSKLSDIIEESEKYISKYDLRSDFIASSMISSRSYDEWCIDPRGILTMALSKETYEELGLVASSKCISPRLSTKHVVVVDLCDRTSKTFIRARNAIVSWDERREAAGIGLWNVINCITTEDDKSESSTLDDKFSVYTAEYQAVTVNDVYIPAVNLSPDPRAFKKLMQNDDLTATSEDWDTYVAEIFEWVGMAFLHSPRLKANDRVDPYVAVYEPPASSRIGNYTHICLRGFLSPTFVQNVLDTCISQYKASSAASPSDLDVPIPLLAININTFTSSPVTHVQYASISEGADPSIRLKQPVKSVDCLSLIVASASPSRSQDSTSEYNQDLRWALVVLEA